MVTSGHDADSSNPSSHYGDADRWDLSRLGHCGARFPPQISLRSGSPFASNLKRRERRDETCVAADEQTFQASLRPGQARAESADRCNLPFCQKRSTVYLSAQIMQERTTTSRCEQLNRSERMNQLLLTNFDLGNTAQQHIAEQTHSQQGFLLHDTLQQCFVFR